MKHEQHSIGTSRRCVMLAMALLLLSLNGFAQAPPTKTDPAPATKETTAAVDRTGQDGRPATSRQEAPVGAQLQDPAFQNRRQMLSYAFGVELAKSLKAQRINPDVDLMLKALRDALAGNTLLMSETEATAALKAYDEDQKHDLEHARQMISEKNKKAGEAFVAENVKKEGVVTLPSGLQYKVLQQGDGKKPTINDKVLCHYRGTLLDGKEFDNSYKRNQPATIPVKGVIKGWTEALQLMPVGSKWQLFIPPHLAYGERIVGGIGPNAMLVFDVELISIEDGTENGSTSSQKRDAIKPVAGQAERTPGAAKPEGVTP